MTIFADKCISGMTWNKVGVRCNLAGSLQSLVQHATAHGYQQATQKAATAEVRAVGVEGMS